MQEIRISSHSKWEQKVGYSRVVKVGPMVRISGTTAVNKDGTRIGEGDMYAQTKFIFEKINHFLKEAGSGLEEATMVRIYTTDISRSEDIMKAFREKLFDIGPAATLVEVSRLLEPWMLVEIELEAYSV